MADQYEALLSETQLYDAWCSGLTIEDGCRAIERATIEAFRAKHLPEMNLQRCYEIQRDELMVARVRITELEKAMHRITQECTARKAVLIARNALCTHADYSFAKHGRVCPCGKTMVDFGD